MLNNCEAKGLGCVLTLPIYRDGSSTETGGRRGIKEREAGGSDPPVPPHQIAKTVQRRKEKNPVTETTRKKILRVDHDMQDRRRLINKFNTYSEKIPKRDQRKHTAVQKAIPSNYTACERLPYKRQETQMQNLDKRNKNRS